MEWGWQWRVEVTGRGGGYVVVGGVVVVEKVETWSDRGGADALETYVSRTEAFFGYATIASDHS